ncbi:MAG TPA: AMIN domain-containing protein [Gemmatimonadales bacterium]|jgi:type IV pilus assembly protein PilQ|nr:AMIN domain-containing protein [Gemmatimonadales bacterium]
MTRFYRLMVATAAIFGVTSAARADGPASGEVTGVSVQPSPGRADVIVGVRGAVEVRDFMLQNPNRLVLDIVGAKLKGNSSTVYDGVKRGGVLNLRYSQFAPNVVRVVMDLERAMDYHVERVTDAVRVSFGTDQSFVAWSSSDRQPASEPEAKASPRREPEVQLPASRLIRANAGEEPRITVVWDRASIADVVAGFAAFSGRTIILGKDIKGEVTAEIRNQPWPQAFQAILTAQGLSAQEMAGGIIRVDNPSALASLDSLEPLETSVVRVNYAKAKDLTKSIEGSLTKGRGKVIADDNSNSLIITDTRSKIGNLTEFVQGLDVRTPQVSIKAKLVFVDRTDIEELGVKYDLGNQNQFFNKVVQRCCDPTTGKPYEPSVNVVDLGGNAVAGVGNASGIVASSALDLVFSTALGGFTLTSFLSAVERADLSDIQAEPVVTTLDNRKADILVGEETPVRVIDASSNTADAKASVTFKETGIRLTVTPHVTSNRQIGMELHTERSSIQPLAATDLGYTFQTQRAENQLLVNDGETAVIGGLTVTEVTNSRTGIPLLSGLPIIGKLFSFSSSKENRRDLIILVTPRIIDDGVTPQE